MDFTWHDGERVVRFGRGTVAEAPQLLGERWLLLTTERFRERAPHGAARTLIVGPGRVDDLAGALFEETRDGGDEPLLVAFGGGRVIDTAKALAVATGRQSAAIPTTLSAAEMTRIHRQVPGQEDKGFRRPAIVVNDPDLCASQPADELAASSANSLGHAVEGPVTPMASPVPVLAAREAARLIDAAWLVEGEDPGPVAREQLALASLLSGSTIDSTAYGLHHVMSQTLVREAGVGHGPANAAVLPHTIAALEERKPGTVDPDGTLRALATRLAARAGASSLSALGVSEEDLDRCADAAAQRPQLDLTPPRATRDELRALYEAAT